MPDEAAIPWFASERVENGITKLRVKNKVARWVKVFLFLTPIVIVGVIVAIALAMDRPLVEQNIRPWKFWLLAISGRP